MALTSESEREALARLERGLAGRYALERELGRGATARVFLARDLKHDRQVALKLLWPELSAVVGGARFLREIRLTATLQHPHILPLYDSGDADGLLYYVMPYVGGESLRARLERERQLPVDEALAMVRTLAGALDYAHRQGVVHRDLKPENILLQDGQPLLADFGIALAVTSAAGDRLTETGLSVGTPQYMSPEQATGERVVGPQSDVYSLGAVAYEMLAGEPPVTGPTAEAVLARVVLEAPRAIRTVRPAVPEQVEAAVLRALAKLPADRFWTAGEFATELAKPTFLAPPERAALRRTFRRPGPVAVGAVATVALALALFAVARSLFEPDRSPAEIRKQLTFSGKASLPAISPDGQLVAYVTPAGDSQRVLVQDVAGGAPDTLAAFPGVFSLEWAPDGTRLLVGGIDFVRSEGLAAVLPRLGGPARHLALARTLSELAGSARWLPDGARVSLHAEKWHRVLVVDVETEDSVSIPVAGNYRWQLEGSWSPTADAFAVVTDSIAGMVLRIVTRDGRTQTVVEDSVLLGSPRWSPGGDALYYVRDTSAIWRVRVSPRTGQRRGAPEEVHRLLEPLLVHVDRVYFSLSRDGRRMVYARGARFSNLWLVEPGDTPLRPRTTPFSEGTALRWAPAVSPDGRWIAFAQQTHGAAELFRMPIGGGTPTQITFGARVRQHSRIAWAPDGSRLAFESVRGGRGQVWVATVEGGQLRGFDRTDMSLGTGHLAWAPGARIAYQRDDHRDITLLDPASGDERPLMPMGDTTLGGVAAPQYSPDGNRLAVAVFVGRRESDGVWVFDLRSSSRRKIGEQFLMPIGWSGDGRYVYAYGSSAGLWTLYRLDARRTRPPEQVLAAATRQECTPARSLRPGALVCVVFDFVSDVWMIENFDSRVP